MASPNETLTSIGRRLPTTQPATRGMKEALWDSIPTLLQTGHRPRAWSRLGTATWVVLGHTGIGQSCLRRCPATRQMARRHRDPHPARRVLPGESSKEEEQGGKWRSVAYPGRKSTGLETREILPGMVRLPDWPMARQDGGVSVVAQARQILDTGEGKQQSIRLQVAEVVECQQGECPMDVDKMQKKLAIWAQDPDLPSRCFAESCCAVKDGMHSLERELG